MYLFGLLVGIYSYLILLLGVLGLLSKEIVLAFSFFYLATIIIIFTKQKNISQRISIPSDFLSKNKRLHIVLLILFISFLCVNFIGALSPELAFDALWYHLTLPKIYLLQHTIAHVPGGLLYYSDMPRLGEMLFVGGLSLGGESVNKVIQLLFGVVTSVFIYQIVRKYTDARAAIIAVLIYYGNLVVSWESTTAYIDLIRSFFEIAALGAFLHWSKTLRMKWFVLCGVMLGLAIATKLLALGSLFIFSVLIIIFISQSLRKRLQFVLMLWCIALFIVSPWLIFAWVNTGNPLYPFFTQYYPVSSGINSQTLFSDIWDLFMKSSDPISPLYAIFIPILLVYGKSLRKEFKIIIVYCLLALVTWYVTPRTGGGRFILPYLPAFSIVCASLLAQLRKKNVKLLSNILLATVFLVSLLSLGYRSLATIKSFPVVFGYETKQHFLTNHLHFAYGDFYDTDNYFKQNIKKSDRVLLYGFHNLYYVDFPFIDASWVKKGDRFNYIASQNTTLPPQFKNWIAIYQNHKTLVNLYKPPRGECKSLCRY